MLSDNQFVALKMSNPSRINVFRSLLSSVGLNCCQSDLPPLSPLILFGTSQVFIDQNSSILFVSSLCNYFLLLIIAASTNNLNLTL